MSNEPQSEAVPVELLAAPPVACTLTSKDAAAQVVEWDDLRGHVLRRRTVPGGVAVDFPADLESTVRDLAAREAECCAFLTLTVGSEQAEEIELSVTSSNPDAQPIIELLVGAESPSA